MPDQATDHDLLIRLNEKTDQLNEKTDWIRDDISEIKSDLSTKADASDLEALQKRVSELEKVVGVQATALTVATASANSSVKTVGTCLGWGGGLVTILHYCGWIK